MRLNHAWPSTHLCGIYVDDFIYFSASELVETEFDQRIKDDRNMLVDFEGEPKMF